MGTRGEGKDPNPRRSNSLGCLSDPDCYMNSLWPRLASPNQSEGDTEDPISNGENGFHAFHKRSNSCSSADKLKKPQFSSHLKNGLHTQTSIEGLNQEVSSVLEGKSFEAHFHPDGHIAPVRDLLGRLSVGTQTPPHISTHSSPSSQSPNPTPTPSPSQPAQSPSQPPTQSPHPTLTPASSQTLTHSTSPRLFLTSSPSQPPQTDPEVHAGYSLAHYSTAESLAPPENLIILHPSSPKPSFAREPPDGAERCIIRQEAKQYSDDFIPRGPDRSKANIVFQGTAFAPLLPPTSLKQVPISL